MSNQWTDVVLDRLREHWLAGMSSAESRETINAEFGTSFSRNSIIGKRHRADMTDMRLLEIVGPDSAIAKIVKDRKPSNFAKRSKPKYIALLDLKDHHCRWPIDTSTGIRFCGEQTAPLKSYCPRHCRKVFARSANEQPRRAVRHG